MYSSEVADTPTESHRPMSFRLALSSTAFLSLLAAPTFAQNGNLPPSEDFPNSPVLRIERQVSFEPSVAPPTGFRSIDGSGNNETEAEMGSAGAHLARWADPAYTDQISSLAGEVRPSAREISNVVCAQDTLRPNRRGVTDFIWQWGQFLDHDLSLTEGTDPPEPADIVVPTDDPWFDPNGLGTILMAFNRSIYDPETGTDAANPRQQLNEITAWIDASNVYGSDEERAAALRTLDGTGRLATSEGDFLPYNTFGLPNAGGASDTLFLAGDVRANEQIGLTAMHTLFVREHNRLAGRIAEENPDLTGDQIYHRARRLVGAKMQVITYQEFLPALLGRNALSPYRGYRPDVDASIANIFSTAAYRFGHSTLSPTLLRLDADGEEIEAGHLALRDAFFSPQRLVDEGGLAPLFRGLASQVSQAVDPYVIDDLRNFLFGPPGAGGFDLASLNIQRGRDHGLPSYNEARAALGLQPAEDFGDITRNTEMRRRLREAYLDVDDGDLWVGGLAEDTRRGALVGELFFNILRRQFEALRDGDRYWYQLALDESELREVEKTRLSTMIRRNTEVRGELQRDVFHVRRERPGR